jgi:hypothetical protein
MKPYLFIPLIFLGSVSCGDHSNDSSATVPFDSTGSDSVQGVIISNTSNQVTWGSPGDAIPETHLRDTVIISGNIILFLRPDDERFASYEKIGASGIYEVDSDFGVSIANTIDSLSKIKKYDHLAAEVTTKRFVTINDCKTCPMTIDRDSVNYGYIMSSVGRGIITSSEVHSGNYLMEVDEYFDLDDYR